MALNFGIDVPFDNAYAWKRNTETAGIFISTKSYIASDETFS
jgi:hypothetical protein